VTRVRRSAWPATQVGRLRLVVVAAVALATALKLALAATTFGTNDVHHWLAFAAAVREHGPVGIYGRETPGHLYNHPPLSGWLLAAANWLVDHGGVPFTFLIRGPAILADTVTAVLVFELVRRRRPVREAAVAATLVALSPVLVVISGFHGNTDPLFVMLALLSVYLLGVRHWIAAAGAGVAIASAVSVKLVPVVLGPALLIAVGRQGRHRLAAFAAGAAAVVGVLWVPVLLTRWPEFRAQVLSYQGIEQREWGIVQFVRWAHLSESVTEGFVGWGRFVVLGLCAALPAIVVWRRPDALAPAAGLGLVLFLLLSPAFGMQYLSWAVAAAYLISTWAATGYQLAATVMVIVVYDHWNGAHPWQWWEAAGRPLTAGELALMVVTWIALVLVAIAGLRYLRRPVGPVGTVGPVTTAGVARVPPVHRGSG
jgi:hypothetical protein